ncbi:sodium:solute symporter [Psychroflexus halocasei]|uniref:Transporter, SSS family n=1 Tax=Psychroflexus halocasei TaxID=908615 RepID=A0A1H3ZTQ3_9FLAO|nr:sodium:solute symporter [Psychroflexus halocasei]SEA27050.1 transporter, SSS family [Psychroflexus halocasei]
MELIDGLVLIFTLSFIVIYGVYKTRKQNNVQDYIKGGNTSRWWTVGLSVMATQASAITFLSTPGQAFHDGIGFVQFYFGLPIAVVIICLVFIPIYHKLNVYTAYEYLESRFDLKTRTLTALLFLIQRGLAAGITIFAPSIILSAVLGWNLFYLNIIIGALVIIYTVSGGTKAVSVTQTQQMAVIFAGLITTFFLIIYNLPEDITFGNALKIAGTNGKLQAIDLSFDFDNRYTLWSGLIGGTFLALSYFGTDQSQVQRYLSAKNMKESQMGMLFNGMLKIPMQFFILMVGVMVFVFYQFNSAPLNFNPAAEEAVLSSPQKEEYVDLQNQLKEIEQEKKTLTSFLKTQNELNQDQKNQLQDLNQQEVKIRESGTALINQADENVETNDKDYVFIHFILNNLPRGLIGLLIAVILSAAMSSTASELNALASTTTIDLYKRNIKGKSEKHYVNTSKLMTLVWGIFAIAIASTANLFDNLIQLVNIIGSIFYGNVLGIFLLAFFIKFIKSNAVFVAALITQVIVILGYFNDWMPYLWLNIFGCLLVISIAFLLEMIFRNTKAL